MSKIWILRQDQDSHWFLVPEDLVKRFDYVSRVIEDDDGTISDDDDMIELFFRSLVNIVYLVVAMIENFRWRKNEIYCSFLVQKTDGISFQKDNYEDVDVMSYIGWLSNGTLKIVKNENLEKYKDSNYQ